MAASEMLKTSGTMPTPLTLPFSGSGAQTPELSEGSFVQLRALHDAMPVPGLRSVSVFCALTEEARRSEKTDSDLAILDDQT